MLMIGLVEGVVTGGLLGIVLGVLGTPSAGGVLEAFFVGMVFGGFVAVCVGGPTGVVALALSGALTARRNDEGQVFTRVTSWAARGSAIGAGVGAVSGTSGAALLALALNRNFGAVIGEYLFYGYIGGVIGGFIIGTLAGSVYGALNEKELPVPRLGWLLRRQ
jgi:hypothetical protein